MKICNIYWLTFKRVPLPYKLQILLHSPKSDDIADCERYVVDLREEADSYAEEHCGAVHVDGSDG